MSCCVKILSSSLLSDWFPLTVPKEDFLDKSWESYQHKQLHNINNKKQNLNQFLIHYPSKTTLLTDSTTDKLSTCIWLVILSFPSIYSFIHSLAIHKTYHMWVYFIAFITHTHTPIFCNFILIDGRKNQIAAKTTFTHQNIPLKGEFLFVWMKLNEWMYDQLKACVNEKEKKRIRETEKLSTKKRKWEKTNGK